VISLVRRFPAATFAVCLGFAAMTGCGGGAGGSKPQASSKPRIIFVTNSNADWWTAVEKGMKDAAAELNVDAEMRRNEGSVQGQIRILKDVLSLPDVEGVAVSVIEAKAEGVASAMRELRKAGKIVIAIDSDGAADSREAYIGTDNRAAGRIAGKVAAALRPKGGPVVVFVGSKEAANAIDRRESFFAGAGDAFTELETFTDGGDKNRAAVNVRTAITKYPEMGVMLGIWSYNAPAIAQEINKFAELRAKVTVITFDLDERAVDQLANGWIDATVCQNPYDIGFKGVKLLKAKIQKDQKTINEMLPGGATTIETGVRVILPKADSRVKVDNVMTIEEMKKWLTSKGLKSS
jgi:ribose transport system substrate-binding protein